VFTSAKPFSERIKTARLGAGSLRCAALFESYFGFWIVGLYNGASIYTPLLYAIALGCQIGLFAINGALQSQNHLV
jgi:hypothetical protein